MKKSYIAGIALFVIAALFSLSLLLVLFDFGGMSAAHNSFFFGLGSFFANAYGVCSIFIPAFLIFAASHCFFTKWHFRTGVLLSGSVIPFFTLVGIEKLCRFFAGGDGAELVGAKIFITILIGLMIVALEFLLLSILGDMIERRILDKKLDEDSERPIDAGDEKFDVPRYSQDSDVSVIEQEELYPEFSSYQSDYKEENSSKEKTAPAPADEKSKTLLKPEQRTPAYIGKLLHDSIQEQNAKSQLVSFDRLADDVDRLDLSGKKNPYASIFDEVEKKKAEEEKKRRALAAAEAKKKEQEAHSEPILAPIQIDGVVLDDGFGDDEPVEEDVVSVDEISRAAATAQADIPAEETVPSEIDDSEDADDEYASYEAVAPSETPAQNEPALSDEPIESDETVAQGNPAEENIPSEIEDSDEPALSDEPIESDETVAEDEPAETDGADETFEEETTREAEEDSVQDDDFSAPAAQNEPNEEFASDETYVADEADAPAEPSEPVSREMPDFEADDEDPAEEDFVSDEEISEATATAQADIPAEENIPSEIEDSDEPALSDEPIESDETVAEDEPAEEDECPEVRVSFSNASVINDEGERFEIETDIPQEARRFGAEAEEEAAFDEDEDNFDSDDEDFVDEEESDNDTLSSDDNTMLDSDEDEIAVADSDDDDDEEGFPQTPVGFDLYDRTDDKIDVDIIDDSDYDEDFDEDKVSESEIAATIAGSTVSTAAAKSVPTAQPSSATAHPTRSWANYHVSSDLLEEYPNNEYWVIDDDTKLAASRLMKTLNEFKIEAEVTGICKGPVVTMFEILPAPGVKLNKIVALQDNIALALAARSVRIVAPIPGKHAVGIEVPNKNRAIVSFKEIIDTELPAFKKMGIPVILGKDISGDPQIIDIAKTPHLLIAGATGAGKSVCVNSMLLSILFKRSPAQVKLILVDPKIVELSLYNDIPHLLTPVITEPKRALQALQYCLCEMERRYALLSRMSVRDIVTYNNKIEEEHIATEKLPYIVVIIDEFADLMMTTGKELESSIARLAAKSRAVGIHLVLATQRPSIDVITGLIKANLPSRIAFMVASKMDSRIIIDKGGAETLLGKGDMLYSGYTTPYPVRIQGTLVSDEEVENVVEYVKSFGEPDYIDDEIFIDDDDDGSDGTVYREDGQDPLYDQALEIVIQAGKASASYIQRKLSIGYNRAARLVEEMEERGIVGPQNGSKPREIIHLP